MGRLIVKPEHYLSNPPLQPKRELVTYARAAARARGYKIRAPRIYSDFEHAKRASDKGKKVLARSEHPDEYAGVSGLGTSELLSKYPDVRSEEEFRTTILTMERSGQNFAQLELYRRYCKLAGHDFEAFMQKLSFSYWEMLCGINRAIIADSAIPGRYHIMSNRKDGPDKPGEYVYVVVDNGLAQGFLGNEITVWNSQLAQYHAERIRLYEQVRESRKLDPNHCYIMELQTFEGRDYLLQIHRTRDLEPAEFVLGRPPEKGEAKALFVRGATAPREETVLRIIMFNSAKDLESPLPLHQDGEFGINPFSISALLRCKRMELKIFRLHQRDTVYDPLEDIATKHRPRSGMFDPKISVVVGRDDLITENDWDALFDQHLKDWEEKSILVRVISDGRNAYLKRVD